MSVVEWKPASVVQLADDGALYVPDAGWIVIGSVLEDGLRSVYLVPGPPAGYAVAVREGGLYRLLSPAERIVEATSHAKDWDAAVEAVEGILRSLR